MRCPVYCPPEHRTPLIFLLSSTFPASGALAFNGKEGREERRKGGREGEREEGGEGGREGRREVRREGGSGRGREGSGEGGRDGGREDYIRPPHCPVSCHALSQRGLSCLGVI